MCASGRILPVYGTHGGFVTSALLTGNSYAADSFSMSAEVSRSKH